MITLQKDYNAFRAKILMLLWRQWTALGVAGQVEKQAVSLIDPEALILCSLSLARYDARLFDEIIDWLTVNGEFINAARLGAMQKSYEFSAGPQISAIAAHLSQNSEYHLKWHSLSKQYSTEKAQPLFFTAQGKALPVGIDRDEIFLSKGLIRKKFAARSLSRPFPVEGVPTLLLKLRALMGISTRCEMLCIMSGSPEIHPAEAARLASCNRKTAQNALREMSRSGMVEYRDGGREKYYRMNSGSFQNFIPASTHWIFWAPFYKGLEILWRGSYDETDDPLLLSAHCRRIAKTAQPYFEEAKTGILLTDPSRTPGAEYLPVFKKDLQSIVEGYERII